MEIGKNYSDIVYIKGNPMGIDMGFYGCGEHEWGIQGIREAFGSVRERSFEAQRMAKLPRGLYIGQNDNRRYMLFKPSLVETKYIYKDGIMVNVPLRPEERIDKIQRIVDREVPLWTGVSELVTAWDKDEFAIQARGSRYAEVIELLESAFGTNDVVIDTASSLVKRFGLLVYSRIPEEVRETVEWR
jgi:hypothetical protein